MKKIIILQALLFLTALDAKQFHYGVGSHRYRQAVDSHRVFNYLHKAASKSDISSQYRLALMFHYGNGVRQNSELAKLWFHRAARRGHRLAQSVLYRFYS